MVFNDDLIPDKFEAKVQELQREAKRLESNVQYEEDAVREIKLQGRDEDTLIKANQKLIAAMKSLVTALVDRCELNVEAPVKFREADFCQQEIKLEENQAKLYKLLFSNCNYIIEFETKKLKETELTMKKKTSKSDLAVAEKSVDSQLAKILIALSAKMELIKWKSVEDIPEDSETTEALLNETLLSIEKRKNMYRDNIKHIDEKITEEEKKLEDLFKQNRDDELEDAMVDSCDDMIRLYELAIEVMSQQVHLNYALPLEYRDSNFKKMKLRLEEIREALNYLREMELRDISDETLADIEREVEQERGRLQRRSKHGNWVTKED